MGFELADRLFRARIDPHRRRCGGRKIADRCPGLGRPFEGSKLDRRPRVQLPAQLRRCQIELRRIEDRTESIVAQLLVPLGDRRPQAVGMRGRFLDVDENARGRQIFEQLRSALEEQRQEELHSARRPAGAHVAIDRVLGQIAGEPQAIAAAKLAHGVGAQGGLARGQQVNPVELLARALSVGIEVTDAVNVAVEQVDPVRALRAHREHVEKRSADRELAVGGDLSDGGVARQGQSLAQRFEIQSFADVHLQGVRFDEAARREPLQQGVDRHDPHAASSARQLRERAKPCRGDVRMRREAVIRQRLEVRKHVHRSRCAREERNLLAQRLGRPGVFGDDDERPRGLYRGFGDGESRCRAVESAPLDEGRSGGGQQGVE